MTKEERKAKRAERKKNKVGFMQEFKKFIMRGNIVDMSVGVIVGGAFTAIVNGLSNNILKPIINYFIAKILGDGTLADAYTFLGEKKYTTDADGNQIVDLANSIYIDWGAFINAIINFLIIAFVLFVIVRFINKLNDGKKRAKDLGARVEWKQARNRKLNKKEQAFVAEQEQAAKAAAEAAAAPKEPVITELDVLLEIKQLLEAKKQA